MFVSFFVAVVVVFAESGPPSTQTLTLVQPADVVDDASLCLSLSLM
jgi:hypothetical protein